MLKKIEALRTKPKYIRNRYAFWVALCVTAGIAATWVLHIPAVFTENNTSQEKPQEDVGSSFTHTLNEITSNFKNMVGNMRTTVEYTQDTETSDTQEVSSPDLIDLDALIASSSTRTSATTSDIATSSPSTERTQRDLNLPDL